jgi:hypothetical protein
MNREPTRLLDGADADVDPRLRSALAVVSREAPSGVQLASVVEGVTREIQRSPRTPRARTRSQTARWLKLLSLLALGGLGYASLEPPGEVPARERALVGAPAVVAGTGMRTQAPARAPFAQGARELAGESGEAVIEGHHTTGERAVVAPVAPAQPASVPREAAPRALGPRAQPERAARRSEARESRRSPEFDREVARAGGRAAPAPSELDLLSRAQAFLVTAPGEALRLLAEHELHHARGQFAEERDALRLQLLERLGRSEELERRARAFVAHYPRSPHRERVQHLVRALRGAAE